jgi:hypothetical protein
VVYELLEPALPIIGVATLREQLERLRDLWALRAPKFRVVAV